MTTTLLYQPAKNWQFGVALGAAVTIHLTAIGFANVRPVEVRPAGVPGEPSQIFVESEQPRAEPQPELSEPFPTPPTLDQSYIEETATPPPIHPLSSKVLPLSKTREK